MAPYGRRLPLFGSGNTSIPCRGFWGFFGLFGIFVKLVILGQNPLHGMGVFGQNGHFGKNGQNSLRV